MVTIGDAFAIVSILLGLGVTTWALLVSCAVLFPTRTETARNALEAAPRRALARGLGVALLPGGASIVLLSLPMPGGKLLGWTLLLAVLAVGAIGAAGVSHAAGRRLGAMHPGLSDYAAFVRGAGYLVTASMLPVLGWFAFGPLVLLASLGAGWSAMTARASSVAPAAI